MQYRTVKLRSGKEGRIRPGHPWIYKNQLLKFAPSSIPRPGEIVSVIDSGNKFVGTGYCNPRSEISVRILTFKEDAIGPDMVVQRIAEAIEKRSGLLDKTNAYRAVFSEADGLPGLIIDVYNDTVVFQILTLGMDVMKQMVLDGIRRALKPRYIYEKSISPYRKREGLKDISTWHGETGKGVVEIFESRAKFFVDIENGHKTGFYLDQRRSRMALDNIVKGKKVLDLFCYTGAFSIAAALYGASSTIGYDIKQDWLDLAAKNAELNGVTSVEFKKADAFKALHQIHNSGEKFDVIIIDPPSFTKTASSVKSAARGYKELNYIAMNSVIDGGVIATFSCSHNMTNDIFSGAIKTAAKEAKKEITILKRCHQAEDHPMVKNIPETEYLKGYFLKIEQLQ